MKKMPKSLREGLPVISNQFVQFSVLLIFARIFIKLNITMETMYVSPDIEILELQTEGVLCASNEKVEENEGIW